MVDVRREISAGEMLDLVSDAGHGRPVPPGREDVVPDAPPAGTEAEAAEEAGDGRPLVVVDDDKPHRGTIMRKRHTTAMTRRTT